MCLKPQKSFIWKLKFVFPTKEQKVGFAHVKVVLGLQSLLAVLHLRLLFQYLRRVIATMRKTHVSTRSSQGTAGRTHSLKTQ